MRAILLIALLWTSSALVITTYNCGTATCMDNLKYYILRLNSREECIHSGNDFILRTSHPLPPTINVDGFSVDTYSINEDYSINEKIQDPYREDANSLMYLNIKFTTDQLKNSPACKYLMNNAEYFMTQCKIALRYLNNAQRQPVKILYKQMTVKIPRTITGNYSLVAGPIYQYGCECSIIADAQYTANIYKGNTCTQKITSSEILTYGDDVCLELIAIDNITNNYKFDVTSVKITYTNSLGVSTTVEMLDNSIIKCSLTNICEKGKAYAIVPLFAVGVLKFKMTVVLLDLRRLLPDGRTLEEKKVEGVLGEFEDSVTVPDDGVFDFEDSFASTTLVSILSALAILMLLV